MRARKIKGLLSSIQPIALQEMAQLLGFAWSARPRSVPPLMPPERAGSTFRQTKRRFRLR
jgi:hypothetical protein